VVLVGSLIAEELNRLVYPKVFVKLSIAYVQFLTVSLVIDLVLELHPLLL
jgi:hypothetical protein